jgi:hypothetical protein
VRSTHGSVKDVIRLNRYARVGPVFASRGFLTILVFSFRQFMESVPRFLVINHGDPAGNFTGRELVAVRERSPFGSRDGSLTGAEPESATA